MAGTDSRPAHTLSAADFERHAVWRFAEEGADGDECEAAPVAPAEFALGTHATFIVAARYEITGRLVLPGAVQVGVLDRHVQCTPFVIHVEGYRVDPLADGAAARLARLTGDAEARPRRWTLTQPLVGERAPRSGRIARTRWGRALGLLIELVRLRRRRLPEP